MTATLFVVALIAGSLAGMLLLFFVTSTKTPSLQSFLQAMNDPEFALQGDPEFKGATCRFHYASSLISMFYWKTQDREGLVETLDFRAKGVEGWYKILFIGGDIFRFEKNKVSIHPVTTQKNYWAQKIRAKIREIEQSQRVVTWREIKEW